MFDDLKSSVSDDVSDLTRRVADTVGEGPPQMEETSVISRDLARALTTGRLSSRQIADIIRDGLERALSWRSGGSERIEK